MRFSFNKQNKSRRTRFFRRSQSVSKFVSDTHERRLRIVSAIFTSNNIFPRLFIINIKKKKKKKRIIIERYRIEF